MLFIFFIFNILYFSLIVAKLSKIKYCFIGFAFSLYILYYIVFGAFYNSFLWASYFLLGFNIFFIVVLNKYFPIKSIFALSKIKLVIIQHKYFVIFALLSMVYQLFQGPYIEIPSDPVGVHLYRISQIVTLDSINGPFSSSIMDIIKSSRNYYSYFFSSLFIKFSIFNLYFKLNLLSIFYTLFLLVSFYQIALFFSNNVLASVIAVFFSISLLGVDAYSYYRYYAFAPTLIALVIYFETIIFFISFLETKRKLFLFYVLWGICVTKIIHQQETLFILIQVFFLFLGHLFFIYRKNTKRIITVLVFGVLFSLLCSYIYLGILKYDHTKDLALSNFVYIGQILNIDLYIGKIFSRSLLNDNGYNLIRAVISKSYVFVVLFSLLLTVLILVLNNKQKLISLEQSKKIFFLFLLSFSPFIIIILPHICSVLAVVLNVSVFYRLFYMSLISVYISLLLSYVPVFLSNKKILSTGFIIVIVSVSFWNSFNPDQQGRLYHYFMPVKDSYTYKKWEPLYDFLAAYRQKLNKQIVHASTDIITGYSMPFVTSIFSSQCFEKYDRCYFSNYLHNGLVVKLEYRDGMNVSDVFGTDDLLVVNIDESYEKNRLDKHWSYDVRKTSQYYKKNILDTYKKLEKENLVKLVYSDGTALVYAKPDKK